MSPRGGNSGQQFTARRTIIWPLEPMGILRTLILLAVVSQLCCGSKSMAYLVFSGPNGMGSGTKYTHVAVATITPGSSGSPDYPAQTNVRDGVSYGNSTYTGNMTEPAVTDVKAGVQYGANGTEFTGTLNQVNNTCF